MTADAALFFRIASNAFCILLLAMYAYSLWCEQQEKDEDAAARKAADQEDHL